MELACWIVPLAAAVISSIVWRAFKRGPAGWWLNLLLYGGSLFGVVDHVWHGELFLIGEAPLMDLLLGATITATIFCGWGIVLGIAKVRPELGRRMGYYLGIVSVEQKR